MLTWRHVRRGVIAVALALASLAPVAPSANADMPPDLVNTREIKIALFRQLAVPPAVHIVGSSRAERMDAGVVTAMTGLPAFNFAVHSGCPHDAWAFLWLAQEMGRPPREVIWFLDLEVMRRTELCAELKMTPGLLAYIPDWIVRPRRPKPASAPTPAAARYAASAVTPVRTKRPDPAYLDGHGWWWSDTGTLLSPYEWDYGNGKVDRRRWDWTTRFYEAFHRGWRGITPPNRWLITNQLRRLNELGVRPVIVVTPYHPGTLAALKRVGWARHHAELLTLLSSLRSAGARFDLVDLSVSPRLIKGWQLGYSDGVHARNPYADRILRAAIARSHLSRLGSNPARGL